MPHGPLAPAIRPPNLVLLVFLPFALPPVVSFLGRMVNAAIAPDLVREFALDAADLGLLTSCFFLGFAAMQLPLGLLLDRYGPKPVAATLMLVGAAGCLVYAVGESLASLAMGRTIMGVGLSVSAMGGLKAASLWWERRRFPLLSSLIFGMTGVGGMLATVPLAYLLRHIAWREALWLIAGAMTFVAAVLILVVPPRPAVGTAEAPPGGALKGLVDVLGSRVLWRYAPMAMVASGAFAAFQSLWATIWMRDLAGLDRTEQAWGLFVLQAGTLVGNFGFGTLTQVLAARGVPVRRLVAAVLAAFVAGEAVLATGGPGGGLAGILPLMAALGIASAASTGLYGIVGQRFPLAYSARVSTAMNLLVFLGSMAAQWGYGLVLNRFPVAPDGRYDPAGHALALAGMIALQIAAATWLFWPRRDEEETTA